MTRSKPAKEFEHLPTHADIAARAREIWEMHGKPEGTAEQDWMEAESQLKAAADSKNATQPHIQKSGSVQT